MAVKNKQVDPNKYSKNKDIDPESKRSVLYSVISMGLMLIGIVGIALELFREDGWLKMLLHKIFQSTTNMMAIPVIILVLWLLNRWMTSPNKSEMSKNGDFPMYVMMAIGAYYSYKLVTTGSF
ncbi:hypothetical protein GALL_178820 [mine drainage metagenome]|uniref:Uncharacterized protein n=1 Tax=mine drainage metagenome TaxID=410659 RepID=A0A1J5S757_9ZZZZ